MCNLDISERRLPQDGRIVFKKYTKKNIDIDLRVATGPMNYRREGRHAHPRQAEVDPAADRARVLGGEPRAGTASASASLTG